MTEKLDTRELYEKLNSETGELKWAELQRHFASGVVIKVAAADDLVGVAVSMVQDDAEAIEAGMKAGSIARASERDARAWEQDSPILRAVVAAPWVLVQEAVER